MARINLNEIRLNSDEHNGSQTDFSVVTEDTEVYFKNLEDHLIDKINQADVVVGCMAWLTSEKIIQALANKLFICIIVQQEDFLRPDANFDGDNQQWKKNLRKLYDQLKPTQKLDIYFGNGFSLSIAQEKPKLEIDLSKSFAQDELDEYTSDDENIATLIPLREPTTPYVDDKNIETLNPYGISMAGGFSGTQIGGIRLCGFFNKEKNPAFPRMHNKFALFGKYDQKLTFNEVWTGSFNWTFNATQSFENAIVSMNPKIIKAYLSQWLEILMMSQPLDWKSEWHPQNSELRYGT
jgi:hypothetical protein